MKRNKVSTDIIGTDTIDNNTYIKRKKDYNLRKQLGLLRNFDCGVDNKNDTTRFSKYYQTYFEYESDKIKADLLITEGKNIPQELYDKLLYTKNELGR